MRKIICDVCKEETSKAVRVEARDGEHPHNGSTMYKDLDVCLDCICNIEDLQTNREWTDLRK